MHFSWLMARCIADGKTPMVDNTVSCQSCPRFYKRKLCSSCMTIRHQATSGKKRRSSVYERSSTGLDVARPSRIGVNGAICVPHEKDHTNGNMDQLRFTSVAPLWSGWPLTSSVHYRKQNEEIGICWWRWITSRNGLKCTHYPTKKR